MKFGEMKRNTKHVELEQFLYALSASAGLSCCYKVRHVTIRTSSYYAYCMELVPVLCTQWSSLTLRCFNWISVGRVG